MFHKLNLRKSLSKNYIQTVSSLHKLTELKENIIIVFGKNQGFKNFWNQLETPETY